MPVFGLGEHGRVLSETPQGQSTTGMLSAVWPAPDGLSRCQIAGPPG